jgi:glycine/D-amino acid oxidase-like deaminating enzyme
MPSKFDPKRVNSIWVGTTPKTNYPTLNKDLELDVLVVGGGIVGISCVQKLQEQGLKVVLVEKAQIVMGTSGSTTAKLTSQHSLIYHNLLQNFGLEQAQLYAKANEWAIQEVFNLSKKFQINCDLLPKPAYTYIVTNQDKKLVEAEVEAAKRLGISAYYTEEIPLPFDQKAAVVFENQAQFHVRKYLLGLAKKFVERGGEIFENSEVKEIQEGLPITVKVGNFTIKAKFLVLATKDPIHKKEKFEDKLKKKISYVVSMPLEQEFPDGMFISNEENFCSLRTQKENGTEFILYGGNKHMGDEEMDPPKSWETLEKDARDHYKLGDVKYYWFASDNISSDTVPFIGEIGEGTNIYGAYGFGGWGMTHGIFSGQLITDLITQKTTEYKDFYSPQRSK